MKVQLEIKNFDKQQAIFDCPAKFVIVPKGRRFGLTRGNANNFIRMALERKFKKGLWVDTVNANIDKYIERYFIPNLKRLPPSYWQWKKQAKTLYINKAYIDFRSVETPENMEGFGYDLAFLNEAGIILKDPYLWNNAIRPMFWDSPNAKVIIGGTPKGKGVFFELNMRGLDPLQAQYKTLHYTSFDSPYRYIHEAIMADMKDMPERVVKQEIYAEFLDDTGVVFTGVNEVAILQPVEPKADHLYVIGCDLAKVQDYTVLSVYDRTDNHQVYQMRFNQLEWPFQKKKIKDVSMKFNRALVVLDSTGVGEPIADDLMRDGIPVQPIHLTNENKKQMIEKLANWIELKNIYMLKLDETINEFNSFTYDMTLRGNIIYGAPVGFHDDIVCSHFLAVWSLNPIYKKVEPKLTPLAQDYKEKSQALTIPENAINNINLDYEIV